MVTPTRQVVRRPTSLDGWANRILRIDLSSMTARVSETAPYVPAYLGGRGIAARIAWDEYAEPVDPFDERCPIMIFAGTLTGSRSPYSGRATVCTFSPQSHPHSFFTHSSVGGQFGAEMKRAGYDGIIVTGMSDTPVRILVEDDVVRILPADDLWGQDALDSLAAIEASDGKGTRSLVIGPTGERLSRMATINTASSSACGQGGFGAVMGAKRLKAITVVGSGKVTLADSEGLARLTRAIGAEARTVWDSRSRVRELNQEMAHEGLGSASVYACSASCASPCNIYYRDVPGRTTGSTNSSHWACVGNILRGMGEGGPIGHGGVFDWRLGLSGGLEMNVLCNRYGINQWELIIGLVPWLEACQGAGQFNELEGMKVDWTSPDFWAAFLRALAYREGTGDALAEGGVRAARSLGMGEDLVSRYYSGWGYAGHWDGHGDWANHIVFPFWLVPVLQWLTATRDPIPGAHGYVHGVMYFGPFSRRGLMRADHPMTWDHMMAIGERVYGSADALNPLAGYRDKGFAGFFHAKRAVMKDCLPLCDFAFPMIYSPNTDDHFCMVDGIPGTSLEHRLFTVGTGVDWTEDEFERAAERVHTLERALTVRHWGRDRRQDERVLGSFEYEENWQSPLLDRRYGLDRGQFVPVIDEYYAHHGWDPQTGWPTKERLDALGLGEVSEPMLRGAAQAQNDEDRPDLPAPSSGDDSPGA